MKTGVRIWIVMMLQGIICTAGAQSPAQVRELDTVMMTYPFADPNPTPETGKIYPYYRFDGFTNKAEEKSWKMVELENDFIKVQISPEIGGKIWAAYDKTRNKPFIYANDVVKFRDIAMRGPWTSGGIEFNFGIIGHTPAVSAPVDYMIRQNPDGSASCFIAGLDLLTRSHWGVEIRLPHDAAWFSTRVFWYNDTPVEQPYYTWMNLAVTAEEDLRFVDPGTHYISHGGEAYLWPMDINRQKDLSVYAENDFTGSKSYHILGKHTDYFGTHYRNSQDGMIHVARRDDKVGKKVFLWALSGSGKIWESLLTEGAGQYVEVQSGRLFNQNSFSSSRTPFKQIGFQPYQTDEWTEYWYPYHGLDKVDHADPQGVMGIYRYSTYVELDYMAVHQIADTLVVRDTEGNIIWREALRLDPLERKKTIIQVSPESISEISFGDMRYVPEWVESLSLSRPMEIPKDFDQESGYNHYFLGRDAARFRQFGVAEKHIRLSLQQDSFFIPALVEMSKLHYRAMKYDSAFVLAREALRIDTYHPEANYYYGLAAQELRQEADALDGWEIAALSPAWRSAAWYQIAAHYMRKRDWAAAGEYLDKVRSAFPHHVSAIQLQIVWNRVTGNTDEKLPEYLRSLYPVNHFLDYEKYRSSGQEADRLQFQEEIRNELPEQTYIELALWYDEIGRDQEAIKLLEMSPENNLVDYWRAYFYRNTEESDHWLQKADSGLPRFVFPFRKESAPMLEWAMTQTEDWKPRYYLALLRAHTGRHKEAGQLLVEMPDYYRFAPLYAWRAKYQDNSMKKEDDLRRALALEPDQWRYHMELADHLAAQEKFEEAQNSLEEYYQSNPDKYQVGMALARLYLTTDNLMRAEDILAVIHILPYEGAYEGRVLYRAVKLLQALDYLGDNNWHLAAKKVEEAQLWPENLGVGKPFQDQINSSWEDQIKEWIRMRRSGQRVSSSEIGALREKIAERFFEFEEIAPF